MKNINQEFVELISEHQNLIKKVCNVYAATAEDRKDLFQDIVFQLWKSYPSFNGKSKITTWMYRVSLNTAITQSRKDKKAFTDINYAEGKLQDHSIEKLENAQLLKTLISFLNPVEKSILLLYLEENSYEEIADILGITKSNVSVRLVRIKRKLEEKFNTEAL